MKKIIIILIALIVFSCKTSKESSRRIVSEAKKEQTTVVTDSTKVIDKTTHELTGVKSEETSIYSILTNFAQGGAITSTLETFTFINSITDFRGKSDNINTIDFNYKGKTILSDTSSTIREEVISEKSDSKTSRLWIVFSILALVIAFALLGGYLFRNAPLPRI